jgi:hypothetical protein
MKRNEPDCTRFAGELSLWRRRWLRALQAVAVIFLLLGHSISAHAGPSTAKSYAHVYLLRGVLNIFSLGLDDIADKLRQQGVKATVANYLYWSSLADEAAAAYKSGQVRTIILVGHSSGATSLPDMIARLDKLGVPVKLAIGLDSVFSTTLSGRVGRYINFYVGDGAGTRVKRSKELRGELDNVDVEKIPDIGHMTIDKNRVMQRKVIRAIDAAL